MNPDISWLLMKPAHLVLHSFQKRIYHFEKKMVMHTEFKYKVRIWLSHFMLFKNLEIECYVIVIYHGLSTCAWR